MIDGKIRLMFTFNMTVDSDDLDVVDEIEDQPYNDPIDHDDHDFLLTQDNISILTVLFENKGITL